MKIVVTGGPGAGKTALLKGLESRGFAHIPESARTVIRNRKQRGLSPRPQPEEFAREILRLDLERYRNTTAREGPLFFDRGILDALCMLDQLGALSSEEADRVISEYPYFRSVFVLPPWREIYRTDQDRDQTFAQSVHVHETLCDWYRQCGYELITVPPASVARRCAFVLSAIGWDPSP